MADVEGMKQRIPAPVRIQNALEEMKRRGVNSDYCPRCNTFEWNVDIIDIPASSAMSRPTLAPPPFGSYTYSPQPTGFLSMLSVVCKNCGYTMSHNMGVLGV